MDADRRRFLLIGNDTDELIAGGLQIATSGSGGTVLWLTAHNPKVLRGRLIAAFPQSLLQDAGKILFVCLSSVTTHQEVTAWISCFMQNEDELPAAVIIDGLPWHLGLSQGAKTSFLYHKACIPQIANEWQDLAGLWGFRSMQEMPALWLLAAGEPLPVDSKSKAFMRDVPWIHLDGSWSNTHNAHNQGDLYTGLKTLNLPDVLRPNYDGSDLFD